MLKLDLNLLSRPAYLYVITAVVVNILSLILLPLNCNKLFSCLLLLAISILLTVFLIYLITWAIDKLYRSGYIIFSWILASFMILVHLSDLGSFFGPQPSSSSGNANGNNNSNVNGYNKDTTKPSSSEYKSS